MLPGLLLRAAEAAEDAPALEALYRAAFPEEDLLALLRDLSVAPDTMSLVAILGTELVGHVVLTRCAVDGAPGVAALLGPLAVAPAWQRKGIGGALIREGLRRMAAQGVMQVQVLGDPAYYGRFGFAPDGALAPPYPLPEAWRGAWQSLGLRPGMPPLRGTLVVPAPWRRPGLWAP